MGKKGRRSPLDTLRGGVVPPLTEPRNLREGKVAFIPKLAARFNTAPYKLNKRLIAAGLLEEPNQPSQLALRHGYCQRGVSSPMPPHGYWVWKIGMVSAYLREYDREQGEEWERRDEADDQRYERLQREWDRQGTTG